MAKAKRTREDDGSIGGSESDAPKSKKSKNDAKGSGKFKAGKFWELGNAKRRVTITEIKGQEFVDIREFYEKDGEMMPGKKGLMMTLEQYRAFAKIVPEINAALAAKDNTENDDLEEEAEEVSVSKKRARTKSEKANIETTSDEEDE